MHPLWNKQKMQRRLLYSQPCFSAIVIWTRHIIEHISKVYSMHRKIYCIFGLGLLSCPMLQLIYSFRLGVVSRTNVVRTFQADFSLHTNCFFFIIFRVKMFCPFVTWVCCAQGGKSVSCLYRIANTAPCFFSMLTRFNKNF